ncbi:MAG: hypothetical protein ABFR89_10060 [Actinomycetota bacterium]
MTGLKTAAIVVGAVVAILGVFVLAMASPPTERRDADGYYMDDLVTFDRPSRAIVVDDIDILKGLYGPLADDAFLLFVIADPVDLRMQGVASGPDTLFMGVAPTSAVDAYLDGVAHDEITDLERHSESKQIQDVHYTTHEGTRTPGAPGTETFWVTSVAGTDPLTLDWTVEPGDWTAVIMNADASNGVTADLAFGAAAATDIDPIARIASTVALIALIGGGLLLLYGLLRRG